MSTLQERIRAKIPGEDTGIQVKRTLCDICAPGFHCGIDAYVKDGKVIKVAGTKEHPFNKGKLCTKGASNRQYIYREDRLKTPLRRVGERGEGKFEPISWEEAYSIIAEKLNGYKRDFGADSVAFFSGYAKWYRQYLHRFAYSFGSINYGSECSTCYKSTVMAWEATAGTIAKADFGRTNTVLGFALNTFHSNHLAGPNLMAMKDRGVKFIIVDPRKTPATQKLADIHLQIRPGTDGALALGMGKIIIDNGWHDGDFIQNHTHGFEQYAEYVKEFDLDRVCKLTGLRGEDIERATALYATNGPASIQESASPVTHHINGFQNYRAIACLHGLTGNYDRAGGQLPMEATFYDQIAGYHMNEHEYYLDRQPREKKPQAIGAARFPLWSKMVDEFQAMDLSRQILEGTPYPIKAIMGHGMNAKMFPDTPRMYEALKSIDFFVNVELFMTDTAKYADILLPAVSSFERGEFKAYPGGFATYTNPVIEPLYDARSDTRILQDLAVRMDIDDDLLKQGYEAEIAFMLKGNSVTIQEMKDSELPITVPEATAVVPGAYTAAGMDTPTGKFEFYSETVAPFAHQGLDPLPTYRDPLSDADFKPQDYPFVVITGARIPNALHSRLHDMPWLRSLREHPMADINAEDAAQLGLVEGDMVFLESPTGAVEVAVCPSIKIRRGEVHLYHGYREANANDLVGKDHLDPYSGFPGFKSNPCSMRKK